MLQTIFIIFQTLLARDQFFILVITLMKFYVANRNISIFIKYIYQYLVSRFSGGNYGGGGAATPTQFDMTRKF